MQFKFKVGKSPTLNGIRCLLAEKPIKEGEIIEAAPIILIPKRQVSLVEDTTLGWYNFEWNDKYECFVVGYSILINHSYEPNARFIKDFKNMLMNFVAIKDIKQDEEIFINYNGNPKDKSPLPRQYTDYKL